MSGKHGTLAERLWRHVVRGRPDECWVWTGYRNRAGYGHVGITGRKVALAHRVAYEVSRGRGAAGYVVMHSCDNPPCCNPAHLVLGLQRDNVADMKRKGRSCSRLTAENVEAMFYLRMAGATLKDIGEAFGLSRQACHQRFTKEIGT